MPHNPPRPSAPQSKDRNPLPSPSLPSWYRQVPGFPAGCSSLPSQPFFCGDSVPSIPRSLEAPQQQGGVVESWGCRGSVCLSPSSLMFWTNWNEQHPSIMRATLSGANVVIIIDQDIRTPNGLAIDHKAEKIYFSDATLDKIERCEYDGSHRHVSPEAAPAAGPGQESGERRCRGWRVGRELFVGHGAGGQAAFGLLREPHPAARLPCAHRSPTSGR